MDEQVFLETLKRIRWSTNRDDLVSATRTTLQLLLRRPNDQPLLASLLAQADSITGSVPTGGDSAQRAAAIRQAAVRCVVLLQSAKRGRLSRAQSDELAQSRRHRRVIVFLAAAVATAALYLVMLRPDLLKQPVRSATGEEVAATIQAAFQSSRLGLTKRGDVTIRATHEHTIVTAERLSPDDCVMVAQRVKSMGALMINNTDVGRPSDEKLTKLCHTMHDASLTITQTEYRKK